MCAIEGFGLLAVSVEKDGASGKKPRVIIELVSVKKLENMSSSTVIVLYLIVHFIIV